MVISILFCSPKMYGSQSGSRLFILREPFSVYGSFGSRAPVFSYSLIMYGVCCLIKYINIYKTHTCTGDINSLSFFVVAGINIGKSSQLTPEVFGRGILTFSHFHVGLYTCPISRQSVFDNATQCNAIFC